jgi:serine/threonine protein kinase
MTSLEKPIRQRLRPFRSSQLDWAMEDLQTGDRLKGTYRVLEAIGRGGFGQTYSAEGEGGQFVAIKELDLERAGDLKSMELFEREGSPAGCGMRWTTSGAQPRCRSRCDSATPAAC